MKVIVRAETMKGPIEYKLKQVPEYTRQVGRTITRKCMELHKDLVTVIVKAPSGKVLGVFEARRFKQ